MSPAVIILLVVAAYLAVGAVVATLFLLRAVSRRDPAAAKGTWGFRILVWPGCVALWPVALRWWAQPKEAA